MLDSLKFGIAPHAASGVDDLPHRRISALVAQVHGAAISDLYAKGRKSALIALARQTAMYLSHVVLGVSYTQVGLWFGRDRTTVAHACRLIEEWRESPTVDQVLAELEVSIRKGSAGVRDLEGAP